MLRVRASILILSWLTLMAAKERPAIKIQIVESAASERYYTQHIPGTESKSSTNCMGSATGTQVGNTTQASGSSNCTTTTSPGRQARTVDRAIPQIHLRTIMPDGRHATLWCQSGLRHCEGLAVGFYAAELDGNAVWVRLLDFSGKPYKVKYRYVGGW